MQDDSSEDSGAATVAAAASTPTTPTQLLAPVWHTALIILLTAAASIAGARSSKHFASSTARSNLPSYLASIALELTLAGLVLWGLHLRRTPIRTLLGERRPGLQEVFVDIGAAAAFWIVALAVLGTLAVALQHIHLHPENIRATVSKLAPNSVPELIGWIALSITAGICEEFIFRGYLQLQFARLGHRVWVGVLASALVFGFAHGYEGLSGMLLIVAFGGLFSVFRLVRGNLRAGMFAHAWHDSFSGIVLWFIAHHKIFPAT